MSTKDKTLKWRFRELLEERSMTIRDFSDKSGLHYNTVLAIANGKYQRIGLDTLAIMCRVLKVEVSNLFEWE